MYFAIVFAAKLMIFLHYKTRLAYTPAWCNDFNQGPVMPIIIGFLGIALWMWIATIMEPVLGRKKWINLLADNKVLAKRVLAHETDGALKVFSDLLEI